MKKHTSIRTMASPRLDEIEPAACCWLHCEDQPHDEQLPLCTRHALKVWTLVNEEARARSGFDLIGRPHYVAQPTGPRGDGFVYFIKFGSRIKIGWSSNVQGRLCALPYDEVLKVIPGTMANERWFHHKFADLRETGEWFRAEPELVNFIATLGPAA